MDPIYISTKGDDIVTLAKRIECEGYGLGVVELSGQLLPTNGKKTSYYLCSDVSEEVLINSTKLPILRKINFDNEGNVHDIYSKVLLLRVERTPISRINLYITDSEGRRQPFEGKGLNCTLVLIPARKYKYIW